MNRTKMMLWLKKKETRRIRLVIASLTVIVLIIAVLVALPAILPGFVITIGDRLSFRTPEEFTVGRMYTFSESQKSSELSVSADKNSLPYIEDKRISFKYPETVSLGGPSYIEEQLLQSMEFALKGLHADGLVQVWNLAVPINDLLNRTIENNDITYLSFKPSKSDVNGLNSIIWDYVFDKGGTAIHGLEAFITDEKRLYRISLFVPESYYDERVTSTFNDMVYSVRIK